MVLQIVLRKLTIGILLLTLLSILRPSGAILGFEITKAMMILISLTASSQSKVNYLLTRDT